MLQNLKKFAQKNFCKIVQTFANLQRLPKNNVLCKNNMINSGRSIVC